MPAVRDKAGEVPDPPERAVNCVGLGTLPALPEPYFPRVCHFFRRGAVFRLHSPHFLTPRPPHVIQNGLTPDLLADPFPLSPVHPFT